MWQSNNPRARALARKRERQKNRRPIHIKRVSAELRIVGTQYSDSKITQVRVILNDLSIKGMGMFSSHPLMVGQEIAMTIDEPKRIYLRGRITWCQEHDPDSHVLSAHPYPYRVGMMFVFETPAEQAAVKAWVDQVSREFLYTNVARAA